MHTLKPALDNVYAAIPPPAPEPTITTSYCLACFLICKSPIQQNCFITAQKLLQYFLIKRFCVKFLIKGCQPYLAGDANLSKVDIPKRKNPSKFFEGF